MNQLAELVFIEIVYSLSPSPGPNARFAFGVQTALFCFPPNLPLDNTGYCFCSNPEFPRFSKALYNLWFILVLNVQSFATFLLGWEWVWNMVVYTRSVLKIQVHNSCIHKQSSMSHRTTLMLFFGRECKLFVSLAARLCTIFISINIILCSSC